MELSRSVLSPCSNMCVCVCACVFGFVKCNAVALDESFVCVRVLSPSSNMCVCVCVCVCVCACTCVCVYVCVSSFATPLRWARLLFASVFRDIPQSAQYKKSPSTDGATTHAQKNIVVNSRGSGEDLCCRRRKNRVRVHVVTDRAAGACVAAQCA